MQEFTQALERVVLQVVRAILCSNTVLKIRNTLYRRKSARGERGHLPCRCWIGQALVVVLRDAPVLENVSHDVVTQQFQV